MKIDAHQHFWQIDRGDYGWLTPELGEIYQDFLPQDLISHLHANDVSGTILVQAAPTIEETHFMLKLADSHDFIMGVVGWVDFESPTVLSQVEALAKHEKLVGVRPMIQDKSDKNWILNPDFAKVFEALIANDLSFDALVLPKHLCNFLTLLDSHPTLRTIIDHGAKPEIARGLMDSWARDLSRLADQTNAYCKLSGLATEAAADWKVDDLRPFADHIIKCFGADRVIWGSDWPVLNLAGDYAMWCEATNAILQKLSEGQRQKIFSENAIEAYKLGA